jgi:hypothetical protein
MLSCVSLTSGLTVVQPTNRSAIAKVDRSEKGFMRVSFQSNLS